MIRVMEDRLLLYCLLVLSEMQGADDRVGSLCLYYIQ